MGPLLFAAAISFSFKRAVAASIDANTLPAPPAPVLEDYLGFKLALRKSYYSQSLPKFIPYRIANPWAVEIAQEFDLGGWIRFELAGSLGHSSSKGGPIYCLECEEVAFFSSSTILECIDFKVGWWRFTRRKTIWLVVSWERLEYDWEDNGKYTSHPDIPVETWRGNYLSERLGLSLGGESFLPTWGFAAVGIDLQVKYHFPLRRRVDLKNDSGNLFGDARRHPLSPVLNLGLKFKI